MKKRRHRPIPAGAKSPSRVNARMSESAPGPSRPVLPAGIDSAGSGGFTRRKSARGGQMSAAPRKKYEDMRSARWYGAKDLRSFGHRSRTKQMGFAAEDYAGKPVIAILNTWSELNPCHQHFRERAEAVRRGVLQAGGFPVELPAMALG